MPDDATGSRADRAEALYKEHERLEAEGKKESALDKLRDAAALGAPYAISALAYEYYNHHPERMAEALRLYRSAVGKGDLLSAWNLARHYEMQGNIRCYFRWLEKASEMGMDEATEELNSPFPYLLEQARELLGKGEIGEANKLLRIGARHGNAEARKLLARR